MYLRKPIILLLLLTTFLSGRGVNNSFVPGRVQTANTSGIEVEQHIFGKMAEASLVRWKIEVARRFPNAYVVDSHGGDDFGHPWCLYFQDGNLVVNAHDYALKVKRQHPDRPIVFLGCNKNNHPLGVPGVYHARDEVWFNPDKTSDNRERSDKEPGIVGNIFEFVDD